MAIHTFFTCVIRFFRSIFSVFVSVSTFSLSMDDIESRVSNSLDGLNIFLSPVSFSLTARNSPFPGNFTYPRTQRRGTIIVPLHVRQETKEEGVYLASSQVSDSRCCPKKRSRRKLQCVFYNRIPFHYSDIFKMYSNQW